MFLYNKTLEIVKSNVFLNNESRMVLAKNKPSMDRAYNKKHLLSVPIPTQRIGDNSHLREVNIKATKTSDSSKKTLMQKGMKTSSNVKISTI